jgi:hypothetical protein
LTPIIGIIASSKYIAPAVDAYESIATINAGGSSQVSFTSIPTTFEHLQMRCVVRSTNNMSNYNTATVVIRINGANIRGAIYAFNAIGTNGSSVTAGTSTSQQESYGIRVPTANIGANVFGVAVVDFFQYKNTNINKTWRGLSGYDDNSSNHCANLFESVMIDGNAISSIYLSTDYNYAWATGTQFALYGIKKA